MKKYNNNKLYSYQDLCDALDENTRLHKKQNEGIKEYFAKNPIEEGYSGRRLNGINYLVAIGGKVLKPILRKSEETGRLMTETFRTEAEQIEQLKLGNCYPLVKN